MLVQPDLDVGTSIPLHLHVKVLFDPDRLSAPLEPRKEGPPRHIVPFRILKRRCYGKVILMVEKNALFTSTVPTYTVLLVA